MVKNLNEDSFKQKIFNYEKEGNTKLLITNDTILEFWVTWCPHCQAMIPRYETVSETYPLIDCYRVEMEQHPKLAELFDVESFPTFLFITKHGEISKWVGEVPEEELERMTKEAFHLK